MLGLICSSGFWEIDFKMNFGQINRVNLHICQKNGQIYVN
jgi:hypothetical protein